MRAASKDSNNIDRTHKINFPKATERERGGTQKHTQRKREWKRKTERVEQRDTERERES